MPRQKRIPRGFAQPKSVIISFSDIGVLSADFSGNADEIEKPALIMVEGDHIDSQKRHHEFSAERIEELAQNTNAHLRSGGRIPWQQDHAKTQQANIGDLVGEVEVRRISPGDLPNPNTTHLVGRLGLFGTLVGRGMQVVADIAAKKISTISPGIDVARNMIREVSATPTPAIIGLSTFKAAEFSSPTSWEEAEELETDMEELYSDYMSLCEKFWQIVGGVMEMSDSDGSSPKPAIEKAVSGFTDRLKELFDEEGDEMDERGLAEVVTPFGQGRRKEFTAADSLARFGREVSPAVQKAINRARLGKSDRSKPASSSQRRSGGDRPLRGRA